MLLAIDAGNTNIVFALVDQGEIRARWRIATDPRRTADEYAVWLHQLLQLEGFDRNAVEAVIVATVVPRALHNLEVLASKYFGVDALIAGRPPVDWGITLDVDEPQNVGPYPSVVAVRETLHLLQRLFPVRQCEDGFYRNRSRPCLQYQIGRCTAPCVGLVSAEDYGQDVRDTILFLDGRTNQVIDDLVGRMEAAAARLEFEEAARIRDQIANLRRIQERQHVSGESGDLDILALAAPQQT
jgi:hypothetical protein